MPTLRYMLFFALVFPSAPRMAQAEEREHVFSLQGALVFPRFDTPDPTIITLSTWGVKGSYQYGVSRHLYLVARGSFMPHAGLARNYTYESPKSRMLLSGALAFHGEAYRGETGVKWKILGGYNLAPYIELCAGYQWTTYRDPDLRDTNGVSYDMDIPSFGRGSFTLAAALSADYRLANSIFLGAGVQFTYVLDKTYRYDVQIPITIAYYFF